MSYRALIGRSAEKELDRLPEALHARVVAGHPVDDSARSVTVAAVLHRSVAYR
ncbi:MAG TPA: hypothetical protein VGQ83_13270 [Polyangia bacterium]